MLKVVLCVLFVGEKNLNNVKIKRKKKTKLKREKLITNVLYDACYIYNKQKNNVSVDTNVTMIPFYNSAQHTYIAPVFHAYIYIYLKNRIYSLSKIVPKENSFCSTIHPWVTKKTLKN